LILKVIVKSGSTQTPRREGGIDLSPLDQIADGPGVDAKQGGRIFRRDFDGLGHKEGPFEG
jgi:hypothetical protein